jgi:pyroglutamyl-peptidase
MPNSGLRVASFVSVNAMADDTILVTGFGPYHEPANASGELVRSLRSDLPEELAHLESRIAFEVIHCDQSSRQSEHESLETELQGLLECYKPVLCIHTGQAPPNNRITVEKIATNSFMRKTIDPARPVAYWSNLPGTDGLRSVLEDRGVPATFSFYAGQHLCNHILYSSRYFAETRNMPHRSGFIHIPILPEQVAGKHRKSPFMTLEMTRRALSLVVSHVFETFRKEHRRIDRKA